MPQEQVLVQYWNRNLKMKDTQSCISKDLSGAECHYAVVEKECFAIIWAVKMLSIFLDGKELTVFTDHAPLQWLQA